MKRRENLSKALYDFGKLVFAGLVIGYFINTEVKLILLIMGTVFTTLLFIFAYRVDSELKKGGC